MNEKQCLNMVIEGVIEDSQKRKADGEIGIEGSLKKKKRRPADSSY
jgi:hypothetical protein